MMETQKQGRENLLIFMLLLITVSAVCVTVWALFFREADVVLAPDTAPVAEESNAQPIPDDSGEAEAARQGSGNVSLTYSNAVTIDLSSKSAYLIFANPGRSNQDMVLQIVIQDTVIHQTGRITPGNQVTQLNLTEDAAKMLRPGGYEGCFLIAFYDPTSGERAVVNTEIPVSITVTE